MSKPVFDLALKLKLERNKRRLSQKEVAEAIGVTKTTISQYESGQSTPPPLNLARLAVYFDVSTDYLLGLESEVTVGLDGLNTNEVDAIRQLVKVMKDNKTSDGIG